MVVLGDDFLVVLNLDLEMVALGFECRALGCGGQGGRSTSAELLNSGLIQTMAIQFIAYLTFNFFKLGTYFFAKWPIFTN